MAILQPDKILNYNGLTVKQYLLTEHNDYRISMPTRKLPEKPIAITIHNTDWINVSSNTTPAEQYTRACRAGNLKDVRVHYFVDNVCAWQNLPLTLSGWHAADGSGNGNRKTIAIECIMRNSKDEVSLKSEDNCAKLAAYLLNKYDLTVADGLTTHTHWLNVRDGKRGNNDYLNTAHNSYKNCPLYILPHWDAFKAKVQMYLDKLKGNNSPIENSTNLYRVRKNWNDSESQIGAFSSLENAKAACQEGYSVFDSNGKVVYSKVEIESSKDLYRVRKTWEDSKSQIGAFNSLDNAKAALKEGYLIFDSNGKQVYPEENKIPSVYYRVYSNNKWNNEITNYNTINSMGYAGIDKYPISGLAIKVEKGTIKYRVHLKNGGWLSWIGDYNINNWSKGCAGLKTQQIDGIQIRLEDLEGYEVKYRVSTTNSNSYLAWVTGENDYAGIFGKTIDKVQIEIVKK